MTGTEISTELTPESLNRLRRLAKEASPTLQREVNKGLRIAGKVGSEAAQAAILAASPPKADQRTPAEVLLRKKQRFSQSHGSSGLRSGIAKGIRVALGGKQGIRIISSDKSLAPGQKTMNRVYRLKSFRHPVFGNKKAWANQHGADYFFGPINSKSDEMRSAIESAMVDAAEKIAKD